MFWISFIQAMQVFLDLSYLRGHIRIWWPSKENDVYRTIRNVKFVNIFKIREIISFDCLGQNLNAYFGLDIACFLSKNYGF